MKKKKTNSVPQLNDGIFNMCNTPETILEVNEVPETILEVEDESDTILEVEEESDTILEVEEEPSTILEVDDESEKKLKPQKTSKDVSPTLAGWCGRCGHKFSGKDEIFCPICGRKREIIE